MLPFLIVSFLLVHSTHALQCMSNCSITNPFGVPFTIADGQCQRSTPMFGCGVEIRFQYDRQQYTVDFNNLPASYDYVYITTGAYFSYQIRYACPKNTDCTISYVQSRVNEMVARNYSANLIAGELGQYIENSTRNGPVQCYDSANNVITCAAGGLCSMAFDTNKKRFTERGCDYDSLSKAARVYVFDGEMQPSLNVECNRDLCNDDSTLTQVKSILQKYGVTNVDGRMIGEATKGIVSSLLLTLSLLLTVHTCFAQ